MSKTWSSRAWARIKQDALKGAIIGGAIAAIGVLIFGGPLLASVIGCAVDCAVIGGLLGGVVSLFQRGDSPAAPSAPPVERIPASSLEPALSPQQEQAVMRFQDQEAARRQAMGAAQTR